ncbi:MAG: DUF2158 domain-containing protein [Bacteroidota bacterium]
MHEIKIGDTVKLKSGGPKMTVNNFQVTFSQDTKIAVCVWFQDIIKMEGAFDTRTLDKD